MLKANPKPNNTLNTATPGGKESSLGDLAGMPEFDTWVPFVRNNVPRAFVFAALCAATAVAFVYARDSLMSACFYLALIAVGNAVVFYMERWTSARDREAVAAGVPSRGWGIDPSKPLMDRFSVDAEVQKKLKDQKATQ
jgi:hypothetical protein